MALILTPGRQEDYEFKASLGYIVQDPMSKNKRKSNQNQNLECYGSSFSSNMEAVTPTSEK
jgi:hypothetical protein